MKQIRLNGKSYTKLSEIDPSENKEVVSFLKEWFDPNEYVIGRTSGSTGKPKEIRLLKKDMLASARITNAFFEIGQETNMLLCLSPSYIAGKMMIVRALTAQANLWVTPPSSSPLSHFSGAIDFAAMVPMQVDTTLSTPETAKRLNRIRHVIIGGAATSPLLHKKLQYISSRCFGTYGMTETVSHVALRYHNGPQASDPYFAIGQVRFATDDRDCLVIHTPHLHTGTFTTNDIVRLIDERHFEWLGRHDNVINSGGIKLFPETLEQKLAPYIAQRFFITSQPDDYLGEKAVLVIEDAPWDKKRCTALKKQIKQLLPPYEVPKNILFQNPFRETYSGKVIRKL